VVVVRDAGAVIAFVVVWQAVTIAFSVPAFLVPPPSAIAEAFVANAGRIGAALAQTGVEAAAGFVGGNLLGLILATAFARSRRLERIGLPVAIALRSVPLIAIAPLLTIVLGFGPTTIVVMAVLISFFPALVAGSAGLRAPSSEALALMRVLDAPERVRYLRLRDPRCAAVRICRVQDHGSCSGACRHGGRVDGCEQRARLPHHRRGRAVPLSADVGGDRRRDRSRGRSVHRRVVRGAPRDLVAARQRVTLNIASYSDDWRSRLLSTFARTPFELALGDARVHCESVEGFWQGLKWPAGSADRARVFGLWGIEAKLAGAAAPTGDIEIGGPRHPAWQSGAP